MKLNVYVCPRLKLTRLILRSTGPANVFANGPYAAIYPVTGIGTCTSPAGCNSSKLSGASLSRVSNFPPISCKSLPIVAARILIPTHSKMHSSNSSDGSNTVKQKNMKKKNMRRLGGGGLSLEAFANAKSRNNNYNPSLIKKQKEFYRNAKFVNKYNKSLKQEGGRKVDFPSVILPHEDDMVVSGDAAAADQRQEKSRIKKPYSLKELYEKKVEEDQKARTEREANFQAKKEAREKTESRRKEARARMFKKTRSGQPVMKYRIEHMLETIQGSDKK